MTQKIKKSGTEKRVINLKTYTDKNKKEKGVKEISIIVTFKKKDFLIGNQIY
jgi:hypothetical protein